MIALQQLPDLIREMREMEKRVEELTAKCADLETRVPEK
jgi:hypothetical protein